MSPHRVVSVPLFCSLLIVGCHDSTPLGPARGAPPSGALDAAPDAPGLTALTWNVYVGAEIDRVMQARTPDEAVVLATQAWANSCGVVSIQKINTLSSALSQVLARITGQNSHSRFWASMNRAVLQSGKPGVSASRKGSLQRWVPLRRRAP